MAETEMSKKLTKTIKAVDKLLVDLNKDAHGLIEALKELRGDTDEKGK